MAANDLIVSCEVTKMLPPSSQSVDFVIDGIHYGRGRDYSNDTTSTKLRHATTKVKCWRIVNENLVDIEGESINNFYDTETYIIQWTITTETLDFQSHKLLNKFLNTVYFYWKGCSAAKGYSPLPESIEKDNPPVERLAQWSEPPAFLQLFNGTFVVHKGERNDKNTSHLYILRGEHPEEVHFFEVALERASLRSNQSFILIRGNGGNTGFIWHGAQSHQINRSNIRSAYLKIFSGAQVKEIDEGSESDDFLSIVKGRVDDYFSGFVANEPPRLFYFSTITDGRLLACEIECSHKSFKYPTMFPFLQSHLYTALQPALFLLDDGGSKVCVWQGWDQENNPRFQDEKEAVIATAVEYGKKKGDLLKRDIDVVQISAGSETVEFTNLFPTWFVDGAIDKAV